MFQEKRKQQLLSPGLLRPTNGVHLVDLSGKGSVLHPPTLPTNSTRALSKHHSPHSKDCQFTRVFLYVHSLDMMSTNSYELPSPPGTDHEGMQTNVTFSTGKQTMRSHVTALFHSCTLPEEGWGTACVALSDFLAVAKCLKGGPFKTLNNMKRKRHAYPKSRAHVENFGYVVFLTSRGPMAGVNVVETAQVPPLASLLGGVPRPGAALRWAERNRAGTEDALLDLTPCVRWRSCPERPTLANRTPTPLPQKGELLVWDMIFAFKARSLTLFLVSSL